MRKYIVNCSLVRKDDVASVVGKKFYFLMSLYDLRARVMLSTTVRGLQLCLVRTTLPWSVGRLSPSPFGTSPQLRARPKSTPH